MSSSTWTLSTHAGELLEQRARGAQWLPSVTVCSHEKRAFAGAFFATAQLLLRTRFSDEEAVEKNSGYAMFARGRESLKTLVPEEFAVEHLSGYEWWVRRKKSPFSLVQADAHRSVRGACDSVHHRQSTSHTLALVAFWGGFGHAAHSAPSGEVRTLHLQSTLCSLSRLFQDVVVGACNDWPREHWGNATDATYAERLVASLPFRVQVVPLRCDKGTFLNSRLLRHAQERLRSQAWAHTHVYYSEGDQVLRACGGLGPAVALLGQRPRAYLSPNRVEQMIGDRWVMCQYECKYHMGPIRHWDEQRRMIVTNMCSAREPPAYNGSAACPNGASPG